MGVAWAFLALVVLQSTFFVFGGLVMAVPAIVPWLLAGCGILTVGLVRFEIVSSRRREVVRQEQDSELAAHWVEFGQWFEEPGVVVMQVLQSSLYETGTRARVATVEVGGELWDDVWFDDMPVYAPVWVAVECSPVWPSSHEQERHLWVSGLHAWVHGEAHRAWLREEYRAGLNGAAVVA